MTIAIITGASSGLGKEFVGAVIKEFPEIDEIWMIARRKERLEKITRQYPQKKCRAIGLDLASADSMNDLRTILEESSPDIKLLVSNSGVARNGDFKDAPLETQLAMCDLNVRGATAITHLCLQYMSRGSIVLETCSISGFAPNPGMLVYSATKAYMICFCKGLREELKSRGIKVCALCPGNMATEMYSSVQNKEKANISHYLPMLDIQKAAAKSLKKARRGKAVYTPGGFYKFYRILAKVLPHNLIMKFSKMG